MDGMAWNNFRILSTHHLRFLAAFKFIDYHKPPMESCVFTWSEKMCLTKEPKLCMNVPCVPTIDYRKKVAFPKDSSAVWRSQMPSEDIHPFLFTRVVAWNNRTKTKMDKSELWARGKKLLLCDSCEVCVVPECWIMSNRKPDMRRMSCNQPLCV